MINRELCQIVLQTAYKAPLRPDEQGYSEGLVLRWLYQCKNERVLEEIRDNDQYVPPLGLYTQYEATAAWDSRRRRWRFKLPKGNPPQITCDRGVKLEGIDGSLIYKRVPRGFCEAQKRLSFMEGNIAWEFAGDGYIDLANAGYSTVAPEVRLLVIETGNPGLDDECTIPGEWHGDCMKYALSMMGMGAQDPVADKVDQRQGGSGK
jgi:hypothetical protein